MNSMWNLNVKCEYEYSTVAKNLDDAGALDLMFQGLILDFADQGVRLSFMTCHRRSPLCIVKLGTWCPVFARLKTVMSVRR